MKCLVGGGRVTIDSNFVQVGVWGEEGEGGEGRALQIYIFLTGQHLE